MIKQKKFSFLFFNACFDKNQLKNLIAWILESYGEKSTVDFLEKLKQVGFHEATQAGISLGLEDLQIPPQKAGLIAHSLFEINAANAKSFAGNMTGVEKSQQLIDVWNHMSESLRQNAVQNFRNTNPVNPVFMMAFSGARGNISQVRQLVAMRGLMADPQGAILEFPIQSNFREGLTITEYLISCYGARKGLVDTALRTATSGYLTRRLVDAVQHIVITISDCKTSKGVFIKKNLDSRLPGRVLAENLLLENNQLCEKNQVISPKLAKIIASHYTKVLVRSPLTCEAHNSICQLCYGADLAHGILVNIGEAVGVIAAQSIGEPGTQLTMRTFHTGGVGVFSDQATKPIFSPFHGRVEFPEELIGHFVRTPHGNILYMIKYFPSSPTRIVLKIKPIDSSLNTYIIQEQELPAGSILLVRQNEYVKAGQLIAQSSQIKTSKQEMPESTHPIKSPINGEIFFESLVIWTHQSLLVKTKKQKATENSKLPDIQTLGKLGSFWVFSSSNQQESNFLNTFLRAGDLVSPESFLFNYNFKISQKTQLKKVNANLIIGQSWNQMCFQKIRFHKFGYSLTISPVFSKVFSNYGLLFKNTSNLLEQSSSLNSVQPKQIKNFHSETIFYVKNSTSYSKRQFLIWFPSQSTKSLNIQTAQVGREASTFLNVGKNYQFFQPSYLSIFKNYCFKDNLVLSNSQKLNCFNSLTILARAKNFLNKYSIFKLNKNKFRFSNSQNSLLETSLFKAFPNNFETPTFFSFVYHQRILHAQCSVFLTKNLLVNRKVERKIFKKNYSFGLSNSNYNWKKQNQKLNFLLTTLTKTKFSIFQSQKNNNQFVLAPTTNWVYIPCTKKFSRKSKLTSQFLNRRQNDFVLHHPEINSKFVFLEQGKKFDNFLFSNLHINFKFVPQKFLKIVSCNSQNNFPVPNLHYSLVELLNFTWVNLDKKLLENLLTSNKNSLQKYTNVPSKKIKRTLICSLKHQIHLKQNNTCKLKRENSFGYLTFYCRKDKIGFNSISKLEPRIIARVQNPNQLLIPKNFLFISKLVEQSFCNQNELKNQWTNLQFRNRGFDVKSPLNSKQDLTIFSVEKKPQIKLQLISPHQSGWIFGQQNFRVNLSFQPNSKFINTQTNLKFTKKNITCKPPLTFFSLFFYDFVSFQTSQKFHFKTFSNGWVLPNKTITQGFLKLKTNGEFRRFEKRQKKSLSSVLKLSDLVTFKSMFINQREFQNLTIGQIVRWGQQISSDLVSAYNGRVITLKNNFVIIRLGVPFLASSRGILHVNHGELIQSNSLLVTLKSRRLQTEDIVQGIPKIEQLFEARETQGGEILSNNVHILLQNYFVEALKNFPLNKNIAVSKSVTQIQRFLIDNILSAYLNQGVKISEKHVEIVVRQMTSKVRILAGGNTGLVQGEIVELTWIQQINKKLQELDLEQATYEPIVLGISKSVLQSESFLLAASFQEVSRVLVRSALSRKTDFLRGLHENVILGQLIPAGTGLLIDNGHQIDSSVRSSISLKS